MAEVQTPQEIARAWKREGREFRAQEVSDEFQRQGRESVRERESAILAAVEMPGGEHLREVAEQTRDHRDAGKYTTQG